MSQRVYGGGLPGPPSQPISLRWFPARLLWRFRNTDLLAWTLLLISWVVLFAVEWTRFPSLAIQEFDVVVRGGWWIGLIAGTVALTWKRRIWVRVITGLVAATFVAAAWNWSIWAPKLWFDTHRALYEASLRYPLIADRGTYLPPRLRGLTTDGRIHELEAFRFYPQWQPVLKHGGGYFWAPSGTPEGIDFLGPTCESPVDLGSGWWICRM